MEVRQILSMVDDGLMNSNISRRADFVRQLEEGSYFLETQREDIIGLWPTSEIKAFSFYETRKTPTVAKVNLRDDYFPQF